MPQASLNKNRLKIRNKEVWIKVWYLLSNMFSNPEMAQLQRDIKTYDKDTQQITFRDYSSLYAFIQYLKKKNIVN